MKTKASTKSSKVIKIIKLIPFTIISFLFMFSLSSLIEVGSQLYGPSIVAAISALFVLGLTLIVAIIILIIFLVRIKKKMPIKSYLFVFIFTFIFSWFAPIIYDQIKHHKYRAELSMIKKKTRVTDEVWKMLKTPAKAKKLLDTVKQNPYEVNAEKRSILLALYLIDEKYENDYNQAASKFSATGCRGVETMLDNYNITTEAEFVKIFTILKDTEYYDYCIPYDQKGKFSFEGLINKTFYKAAILSTKFGEYEVDKFIIQAKKIKNKNYRKQAIIQILTDINKNLNEYNKYKVHMFFAIVNSLKNEEYFSTYMELITQELAKSFTEKSAKDWLHIKNQSIQEEFMQIYKLLGAKHPFIQLVPSHMKQYYLSQEKEIVKIGKKNYIYFRNFYSQMSSVKHSFPFTYFYYQIILKSNNKIVQEGFTNEYGCFSYKAYGAKLTDEVYIKVDGREFRMRIGWASLLAPWNTSEGMLEREEILGYRIHAKYTLKKAKKMRENFNIFIDKKWCKEEL